MSEQPANSLVEINDDPVAYIPNTLSYTEGKGEQSLRSAIVGGDEYEQIYSKNAENAFGMVKVSIPATIENIKRARQWKVNKNNNVIAISASTSEGNLAKTFQKMALVNDYEVSLGSETDIELEFKGKGAV